MFESAHSFGKSQVQTRLGLWGPLMADANIPGPCVGTGCQQDVKAERLESTSAHHGGLGCLPRQVRIPSDLELGYFTLSCLHACQWTHLISPVSPEASCFSIGMCTLEEKKQYWGAWNLELQ